MAAGVLRGSLLERTIHHSKDCPKCARGEGHQVFVLTVTVLHPVFAQITHFLRNQPVAKAELRSSHLNHAPIQEDARVSSACGVNGLPRYAAG